MLSLHFFSLLAGQTERESARIRERERVRQTRGGLRSARNDPLIPRHACDAMESRPHLGDRLALDRGVYPCIESSCTLEDHLDVLFSTCVKMSEMFSLHHSRIHRCVTSKQMCLSITRQHPCIILPVFPVWPCQSPHGIYPLILPPPSWHYEWASLRSGSLLTPLSNHPFHTFSFFSFFPLQRRV